MTKGVGTRMHKCLVNWEEVDGYRLDRELDPLHVTNSILF